MTVKATTLRAAIQKAQKLQPVILQVAPTTYAIESHSRPGTGHLLQIDPTCCISCPCEGFVRGGFCWHKAALGIHIGTIPQDWVRAASQQVAA